MRLAACGFRNAHGKNHEALNLGGRRHPKAAAPAYSAKLEGTETDKDAPVCGPHTLWPTLSATLGVKAVDLWSRGWPLIHPAFCEAASVLMGGRKLVGHPA